MSKSEKQKRELRAIKYMAQVTKRRSEESKRMDRLVIRCLLSAVIVFAWAVVLALLVGVTG